MPVLSNTRHELFCQNIAKGLAAREAYKAAGYEVSNDASADVSASRLLSDAKITGRVAELQEKTAEKATLTRSWVLTRLMRNASLCMGEEKIKLSVLPKGASATVEVEVHERDSAAANRALELLGREFGLFTEKKEIRSWTLDEVDTDELAALREAVIRERARRTGTGNQASGKAKPN